MLSKTSKEYDKSIKRMQKRLIRMEKSTKKKLRRIDKWTKKKKVKQLIKVLQGTECVVAAARALGKIGDQRAVEPLIQSLGDEDPGVRSSVAEALGEIGDDQAVAPLTDVIIHGSQDISSVAAKALIKIGSSKAITPLVKALYNHHWHVRTAAARVLTTLGWETEDSCDSAMYALAIGKYDRCAKYDEIVLRPLIDSLQNGDWLVREATAKTLGQIGKHQAVEPLLEILRCVQTDLAEIGSNKVMDSSAKIIESTAKEISKALGRIGDKRAVGPLFELIQNLRSHHLHSWEVIEALGEIGHASAIEPLTEVFRTGDSYERERVIKALAKTGKPAGEPLDRILKDEHVHINLRRAAAEALNKASIEPEDVHTEVLSCLVREQIDECINLGSRAINPLIMFLGVDESIVSFNAHKVLERIGEPAIDQLIGALENTNPRIRWNVVKVLTKLNWRPQDNYTTILFYVVNGDFDRCIESGESAVDPLIQILGDFNYRGVDSSICKTLVKIGDLKAAHTVIEYLFASPPVRTTTISNGRQVRAELDPMGINGSAWSGFLGDYTSNILDLVCLDLVERETSCKITNELSRVDYEYSFAKSDAALDRLRDLKTAISNNLLHLVARRKDVEKRVEEIPSWDIWRNKILSFEDQRRRAVEELEKRGNPTYDMLTYLNREAWRI